MVVTDRCLDSASETVARIHTKGGKATAQKVDVTHDEDLERMVETTIADQGQLNILHNHAGIQVAGNAEQVDPAGMDASYQINTAPNSGVFYDNEMLAYTTSKAATIAMTKQMAVDYAKFNIRVNALCPGWVDTAFNEPYIAQMGGRDAIEEYVSKTMPIGRWAMVEEIAESALFLASHRSAFMTGHALVVDGGECIA